MSARAGVRVRLAAAALALAAPALLPAQEETRRERRVQHEARLDAIAARASGVQLGLGANVPLGNYLRAGLTVAGGATRLPGGDVEASGRVDAIGRFLLDPFREHRWGPYAGAGLGVLYDRRGRLRETPVLVLGVEGNAARRVRSSVELGLGGGTRVGLVLRWGRVERR